MTIAISPPGAESARQDDIEAIVGTVARLERAQQHEDVEGFIALFAEDPVWTTAHGLLLSGRSAIAEFTRRVLPGAMKESTAEYRVVRIAFLSEDVVAVNVHQRPIAHDGTPLDDQPEGRPLYVMARVAGDWRIVAAQNTQVRRG